MKMTITIVADNEQVSIDEFERVAQSAIHAFDRNRLHYIALALREKDVEENFPVGAHSMCNLKVVFEMTPEDNTILGG